MRPLVATIGEKEPPVSHHTCQWERQLAQSGFRVTRQRATVLDAVCAGNGHTTLSEIYGRVRRQDTTISRSTVYRALHMFVQAGVVIVADTGGVEPYYEIAKVAPHHHLHCRVCGWEQEISGEQLASVEAVVLDRYGFEVATDHLVLFGHCARCRQTERSP